MPPGYPRHWIIETPRVRQALDELRRCGIEIDIADLVIRGAHCLERELENQRRD